MTPELLENLALLLLRAVLSLVFLASGWSHARRPTQRGESIGMPASIAWGLGMLELLAGVSLLLGVFPRSGALLVMLVMAGAIYKKIFVWKTGFFGEDNGGWYYELVYLAAAFTILATGGGDWVLA